LKHLEILVALLAVILVSRHAGNAAFEESTIQAAERTETRRSASAAPLDFGQAAGKGSTEKFLCFPHFIDCSFYHFSQRWV
jgi:hypothetical protein